MKPALDSAEKLKPYLPEIDDNRMVQIIFAAIFGVTFPVIDVDVLQTSQQQLQ